MNKLTEEEIQRYVKERNEKTGVDGISREELEKIDKDSLEPLKYNKSRNQLVDSNGKVRYHLDTFTPRAGSIYFKPSFAGKQVILGIVDDDIIFSDGRWFV